MLKRISFLLISFLGFPYCFGQTIINSTSGLGGHWTLAGSPYILNGGVIIPNGNQLIIDAGVEVKATPGMAYHFEINGSLVAIGTSMQPIVFSSADTTGYSDSTISAGGWTGLAFAYANPDSSILDHCIIRDTKVMQFDPSGATVSAYLYDKLRISNCEFYNNYPGGASSCIVAANCSPTITYNEIHHNDCYLSPIKIASSNAIVSHNHIYNNFSYYGPAGIYIGGNWIDEPILEFNHIHNNYTPFHGSVEVFDSHASIRNNHIHHNFAGKGGGGVSVNGGRTNIISNIVTNNMDHDGWCGITDGGAGILVLGANCDSCYTIIRNNIIANNTGTYSGGGIRFLTSNGEIENNTIVNNLATNNNTAPGIELNTCSVKVYNNIIYGNELETSMWDFGQQVTTVYADVEFDNNFIEDSVEVIIFDNVGTNISPNANNIITGIPAFVNPSIGAGVAYNGYTADWHLQSFSNCINIGTIDTTHTHPELLDVYFAPRIMNGAIDAGAAEYLYLESLTEDIISDPKIFPNPVVDYLFIQIDNPIGGIVSVFNIQGSLVYQQALSSTKTVLPLQTLVNGLYLIRIQYNENEFTGKIIKQ